MSTDGNGVRVAAPLFYVAFQGNSQNNQRLNVSGGSRRN